MAYKDLDKRRRYQSIYQKVYKHKQRAELLEFLGNKCVRCGFTDSRALQIDHVEGGGSKDKMWKLSSEARLKQISTNPQKFQLLCANCNWIKRVERGETR